MSISIYRSLTVLRHFLKENGVMPADWGDYISGYVQPPHMNSLVFAAKVDDQKNELVWFLRVSGKGQVTYATNREDHGFTHRPLGSSRLHRNIYSAFKAMSLDDATNIMVTSYSDDINDFDLGVEVTTGIPSWLDLSQNAVFEVTDHCQLTSVTLPYAHYLKIPAYRKGGELYLSRESLAYISDFCKDWPYAGFKINLEDNMLSINDEKPRPSVEGVDYWGNKLTLWPASGYKKTLTRTLAGYRQEKVEATDQHETSFKIPFIVGGVDFSAMSEVEKDIQYGEDAPWSLVPNPEFSR